MSSYLTVVKEGKRVPEDKPAKKKREFQKRSFYDRLASKNWNSKKLSGQFSEGYDDVCDKTFEEHAKFCRFLRRMKRHRKMAQRDFMFYPRSVFAAGQFWEKDFPVLDIAQFRAAHFLEKYKRLPTSLFWTDYEFQGQDDEDGILESKFAMIEELTNELMADSFAFRDDLTNQRMHHRLSHQLTRDKEFMEYLKMDATKMEDRRMREHRRILKWQDAMVQEQSKINEKSKPRRK